MKRRCHPRRPSPDDGLPVPPGHLRCCIWDHSGPRILPATLEYFRGRTGKPNGIDPVCRICHRRARKRRWREVEAPRLGSAMARKTISGNVGLIFGGPSFAVPVHLPKGTLLCSACFQVLPHDRKHFDPAKDYRVEPVCLECERELATAKT